MGLFGSKQDPNEIIVNVFSAYRTDLLNQWASEHSEAVAEVERLSEREAELNARETELQEKIANYEEALKADREALVQQVRAEIQAEQAVIFEERKERQDDQWQQFKEQRNIQWHAENDQKVRYLEHLAIMAIEAIFPLDLWTTAPQFKTGLDVVGLNKILATANRKLATRALPGATMVFPVRLNEITPPGSFDTKVTQFKLMMLQQL